MASIARSRTVTPTAAPSGDGAPGRPPAAPRPARRGRVRGGIAAVRLLLGRIGAVLGWALRPARRALARARDAQRTPARRAAAAAFGLAWAAAVAGGLLALGVLLYALALVPFTPGRTAIAQARQPFAAVVVDARGEEITRFARGDRDWIPLADVAPVLVTTLVAVEDRRFYDHGGVDLRRTAGAVLWTLLGDPQGGSTLTQQLARNLFPREVGTRRALSRKLREAIVAVRLERAYTKDELLEIYLNTVPFLYNAVGVERGARTYFGVSAARVDTLEAAMLVGMLKGTSAFNPVRNPERALARREVVLRVLVDTGHLAEGRYHALRERPLGLDFSPLEPAGSRAPHFTEHVRRWLEAWSSRTGRNVYDGLTVHTTLDAGLQRAAARAVREQGDALQAVADVEWATRAFPRRGTSVGPYERARRSADAFAYFWEARRETVDAFVRESPAYARALARGQAPEAALDSLRADADVMRALREAKTRLEVGFVALDPRSGEVRAWVGSRDAARAPFDHVAQARRQPGSTFKPFVYARALEEGTRPDDVLPNLPVEIPLENGTVWTPRNADGSDRSGEQVTVRDGMAYSLNTVAAQLVERVGPRDVARTARRLGVTSRLDPVPSIALGTSETTLLEMAGAYAAIAAEGTVRPPVWVTHLTDRDGREVARFAEPAAQALDPDIARQLIDLMRGVVDRGTGAAVRGTWGVRGDLAGKTGTTQNGVDGWFFLMHPHLVAGAWVGFDDPRVAFRSSHWGQGGHNALRVVGQFARAAQRQGAMPASARFADPPDDRGIPALDRLGDWLAGALGGLLASDDAPPDAADEPAPRRAEPPRAEPRRAEPRPAEPAPEAGRLRREAERLREQAEREAQRRIERELERQVGRATEAAREATGSVADEAARLAEEALRETDPAVREALREAARDLRRQVE